MKTQTDDSSDEEGLQILPVRRQEEIQILPIQKKMLLQNPRTAMMIQISFLPHQ